MFKSYRDASRLNWGREDCGSDEQKMTREERQEGCLLRIADAVELMAKNHATLVAERDRLERWYHEEQALCSRLRKTIVGLRGAITRLKNKED